jgi:hypothetical protein
MFRGLRILHWRDIRRNTIAAFVMDRHCLERGASVENARLRYYNYVRDNRRDSASEEDEEVIALINCIFDTAMTTNPILPIGLGNSLAKALRSTTEGALLVR